MIKLHPFRPKQGSILICEDKIDSDFVSGILNPKTSAITITHGKGRETLPKLAEIFQPAFYIWDRDFAFSVAEAESTYDISFTKSRLIWTHVDIEAYLLHPDWLFRFMQEAPTLFIKISSPPQSQADVENDLKLVASELVPDHAGRRTVEIVNQALNMRKRGSFAVPSGIASGKNISNRAVWETSLQKQANITQTNLQNGANAPELSSILDIYAEQFTAYQSFPTSFETMSLHFSGKRILQLLAAKWGVAGTKLGSERLKDWELIRKRVIDYALDYSNGISTLLRDDIRLGDFGAIASKVTGKEI